MLKRKLVSDRTAHKLYKRLSQRLVNQMTDQLEEQFFAPMLDDINQQTIREFNEAQNARVRLLAIGPTEAVLLLMYTLHTLGFAEPIAWSLPLQIGQGRIELQLEPGEIARIHLWRRQQHE